MYICARLSALHGWWNEQLASDRAFVTALSHSTTIATGFPSMLHDNPQVRAGVEHIDPQEQLRPGDIAASVAWLASDDAAHVQGATLVVDGGRLAQP
jgi:NAD(P)-dependent dehydrogenase (short-subunit alcohol dehydrogenase family)